MYEAVSREDDMTQMKQAVTGFVETNGTKLYYEMMGEGHPLVLIHGGYMDRRMWDDQFAVFAQHYRVIRYDVRHRSSLLGDRRPRDPAREMRRR